MELCWAFSKVCQVVANKKQPQTLSPTSSTQCTEQMCGPDNSFSFVNLSPLSKVSLDLFLYFCKRRDSIVCVCTLYPVYLLVEVKFLQSLITFFCVKIESKCDCRETLALKLAGTIQLGILPH